MASKQPAPPSTIERRTDTVTRIATEIRNAILQGRLLPGERIRQDALAEQLGVSRIPIREALKTLATVGLLEHTLNAGFAVSRLDESELRQIYLLRLLIEDEIMKPLPGMTREQISSLKQLNADMATASANGDIHEMLALNRQFHFEMFRATGMTIVLDVLSRLWDLSMPYHSTYLYDAQTRQRVIHEHDLLLDALESGDADAYQEIASEHRKNSEVRLLGTLRREPYLQRGST